MRRGRHSPIPCLGWNLAGLEYFLHVTHAHVTLDELRPRASTSLEALLRRALAPTTVKHQVRSLMTVSFGQGSSSDLQRTVGFHWQWSRYLPAPRRSGVVSVAMTTRAHVVQRAGPVIQVACRLGIVFAQIYCWWQSPADDETCTARDARSLCSRTKISIWRCREALARTAARQRGATRDCVRELRTPPDSIPPDVSSYRIVSAHCRWRSLARSGSHY